MYTPSKEVLQNLEDNYDKVKEIITALDSYRKDATNKDTLVKLFNALPREEFYARYCRTLIIAQGQEYGIYYTAYKGLTYLFPSYDKLSFYNFPTKFYTEYVKEFIAKEDKKKAKIAATKNLEENEFAFITFKTFIEKQKTIPGVDGLLYLTKIRNLKTVEYKEKYFNLIWKHTAKSISFIKEAIILTRGIKTDLIKLPTDNNEKNPQDYIDKDIAVDLWWFKSKVREHNLIVNPTLMHDLDSKDYTWVTGVKRATKLSDFDIKITLAKILVLMQLKYLEPKFTDVYEKILQHMLAHFKEVKYKDIKEELANTITAQTNSINALKEIHGQL